MLTERTVNIIREFCQFIGPDNYSHWCVGVSAQSEHHLFHELKIAPDARRYIYRLAVSAAEAQAIAKAFWNVECHKPAEGLDTGGSGAVGVFAYRMMPALTGVAMASAQRQPGVQAKADP